MSIKSGVSTTPHEQSGGAAPKAPGQAHLMVLYHKNFPEKDFYDEQK
jgi:hypothetical protein